MARLSSVQESVQRRLVDIAARPLDTRGMAAALLEALQPAVPSDAQWLLEVDQPSLLATRILAVDPGSAQGLDAWLRHVYLQREPAGLTWPELLRARVLACGLAPRLEDCSGLPLPVRAAFEEPAFSALYHAIGTPPGGVLRASLGTRQGWVGTLELGRFERGPGFRHAEVSFMHTVAPLLGRALATARVRETAAAASDASGVLMLDRTGETALCTPRALELLDELGCEQPATWLRQLPIAVRAVAAAARAGFQPSRVRVQTPNGPLRLEAALADATGAVAVVLQPAATPAVDAPVQWALSRREQEVLERLVNGEDDATISQALSMSQHTLETHVRHLCEKAGVRTRVQVLGALFRASSRLARVS